SVHPVRCRGCRCSRFHAPTWRRPAPKVGTPPLDLTGLFWTKRCEKMSLERSFSHAEEEVYRRADRDASSSGCSVYGARQICSRGLPSCRDIAAELRDELLNGEIFYSLKEGQIVIEQWRKHYNTIRPHSALGYRPPAPQTFAPSAHHLDEIMPMQYSLSRWFKKSVRSPRHARGTRPAGAPETIRTPDLCTGSFHAHSSQQYPAISGALPLAGVWSIEAHRRP